RIEPRHYGASGDAITDIDLARNDLAGDTKAEVSLVARPHHTDEFARGILLAECNALHLHWALGLGGGRCSRLLACGEQRKQGDEGEGAERGVLRAHGGFPFTDL